MSYVERDIRSLHGTHVPRPVSDTNPSNLPSYEDCADWNLRMESVQSTYRDLSCRCQTKIAI